MACLPIYPMNAAVMPFCLVRLSLTPPRRLAPPRGALRGPRPRWRRRRSRASQCKNRLRRTTRFDRCNSCRTSRAVSDGGADAVDRVVGWSWRSQIALLRFPGILGQLVASWQHIGYEQDHRLGTEVAADVGMVPSRWLDEGPAGGRHLGRAVVHCARQGAGLHDGDQLAVVVMPAGRAAGGDRDLTYGHVGRPASADHDAFR